MSARALAMLRGLLALALLLGFGRPGAAADAVGIRASEHPGYARVVFDWPEPVAFTVATRGRSLWVRFDHALSADPRDIVRRLPRYVAGARLAGDGKGVDLVLTKPFRLESFAHGNAVAFDLRPIGGAGQVFGLIPSVNPWQ